MCISANRLSGILASMMIVGLLANPVVSTADPSSEVVRVVGADSMAHSITLYAGEFSTGNQSCNILVSGGESGSGLEKILNGEAEVAMMSARLSKTDEEHAKAKGLNFLEAVIGYGGIVFITHPANSVESLSLDQLRKLLTGQISNWKDVGGPDKPVQVITVSEAERAGTDQFITGEFLKGSYAPSARKLTYFRSVPPTVAETEGSLGIIRMRNLERLIEQGQDKRIKVIGVKKDERSPAVTPSRESIDEGTYPLTRPFLLYMPSDKASKCAVSFFKFCEARNPRPGAKQK